MSKAKQTGTAGEVAVRDYLREEGWPAERIPTEGAKDRGDILGVPDFTIEVKAHREFRLAEWMGELEKEQANGITTNAVLWVKRKMKGNPKDWYVVMDGDQFVRLLKKAGF